MIILKHLTVERFRLLREVNLDFPQRGSILIQGPNEAGKSTLFESIYFALYGEPLDHGRRSLDDLILYGSSQATVTLTLSIGTTELTITRIIQRGRGQQVNLVVRRVPIYRARPDLAQEEHITRLGTANERIIAELGCIDGEALRNSCFIEQKGLSRLEDLPGAKREATVRKVLGLEKLLLLTNQFKVTPNDERMLHESAERLKLAEIQARIPELSQQLGQLEAALDAVSIFEDLDEISQQEAEIAEQELSLEQLRTKRAELKACQNRIHQLQKADATLSEIIAAYDAIAEARRELPELEREIAELDRREHEELPALEKRVSELSDLIRSFGTLERMSGDLLAAVNTIKELEQELKHHQDLQEDSAELDAQIIHARLQVDEARQAFNELEERRRAGRPKLEARLQRLRGLQERLVALHRAEEAYTQHVMQQGLADENITQINKVKKEVRETEQELALVEAEAKQVQQQADALEKHWRQLSVGRQLEEWQRLKGLAQRLAEAEQHVRAAHQHQEKLTQAALDARQVANKWLILAIGGCIAGVILGAAALFIASQQAVLASIMGLLVLMLFAWAGYSYYNYTKVHKEEEIASERMQEAINQVGMMVAARETAVRMGGSREALAQIEHEILSLGGTVPRSIEEAQRLLEQLQDKGESLADIQQQVTSQHDAARAARNQVNVTMEAVATLRKKLTQLQEQRKNEGWEDIETKLRSERIGIEDKQHEIATLAGREGLPIPGFDSSPTSGPLTSTSTSDFEMSLADNIKATEREIAFLDGKLDLVTELAAQVKVYQEALDILLARKRMLTERRERFQTPNPMQQIERAREQQLALRNALQSLQDSLRQRVKPLGVPFGQTAISNAEAVARKQLDALHFTLGGRIELQSQREHYITLLKDRQDSLANYYNQLTKLSDSLGSWIVPPNPFAEALAALRVRCQREIEDGNEGSILQELEQLQIQEGASLAKIELCRQDIEEAQERIAAMLIQRDRPSTKAYTFTDVVAVWPLVGEYTSQDRNRLEEERTSVEQELQRLEQQELALSTQLQTGGKKLDLEQARLRMEQQERSYQSKKRGNLLVKTASERLMRKILPRTEYHMQQILSLLTGGRYHDVHLQTETEEDTASDGPIQLRVWDTVANEYVYKSALSGGAADQLSLALRLAFAIAMLPRELDAVPGFLFLDEPLSSFDRSRTQALMDVVAGELLSQHFEQILLISHSSAFDPAMFPYHIYMDGGIIVESNLPVVPTFQIVGTNGNGKDDDGIDDTIRVPVVSVPASVAVEG